MSKGRRGSLLALLLCLSFSAQAQMTFNQGLWEFDVHYDTVNLTPRSGVRRELAGPFRPDLYLATELFDGVGNS